MPKPGLKIYPKRIPSDIKRIIFEMQAEVKKECLCQFSQEQTIYKLIRIAVKKENDRT